MKKLIIFIIILIIVLALAAAIFVYLQQNRNTLLMDKIQKGLEAASGLSVEVAGLSSKVPGTVPGTKSSGTRYGTWYLDLKIDQLKFRNPSGFSQENLAVVTDLEMTLNPLSLIQGRWEISKLSATLDEIVVEKNEAGELNLAKLPALTSRLEDGAVSASNFLIKDLQYSYGTLYFFEPQGNPERPETHNFEGAKEVFRNVASPDLLFQAPAIKSVNQLGRGSLGIRRGKIQEQIAKSIA